MGQLQDPELLADFKRLIAARRSHPALVYGEVVTLWLDDERGLWLSERVHGKDCVLVAVNSSLRNGRVALPPGHFADLDGNTVIGSLVLPARSVVFLTPLILPPDQISLESRGRCRYMSDPGFLGVVSGFRMVERSGGSHDHHS